MPAQPGSSSTPSKPSTRSSIRQSLGLAGKALVDVINKDSREEKGTKKGAKDASSRRLSATVSAKPSAPRASMGDLTRPPRRTMTPDSKTITQSRRSLSVATAKLSLDEQPTKPADATGATVVRSASLRPRTGVSALPKYRPKSIVGDPAKPPSPARAGIRRRLSTSDDEKDEEESPARRPSKESPQERSMRPISPLPQRAAFKVLNAASPAADSAKTKPTPSSSSKGRASPTRPAKTVKTVASSQPTIPRPSSSASSSSSFTPRTPKSPPKAPVGIRRPNKGPSTQSTPLRDSPQRSHSESPLAKHSRKVQPQSKAPVETSEVGNMSHISERSDSEEEDSEEEHVGMLLAPVAAPGAPTPAMPRFVDHSRRHSRVIAPKTPSRSQLPSRANMSYLSPLPPDSDSPSSLRPQQANAGAAGRGSILSWEQLATEASRTLGEDEIASMLSDMPAPFRPGAISPNHHLDIPESPCLSALNSPGEYGSISQVLLPDVTPSPAVHANASARYNAKDPNAPPVDAAIVTLLRLQLASAESIAKERLFQLQAMEEEIHNLKQARAKDAEELANQVGYMEEQLRGSMEMRERAEEDRTAHIALLEDQLRQVTVSQGARQTVRVEVDSAVKMQKAKASAQCSALVAGTQWAFVRDFAESELDGIKGDRDVLAALLADLDEVQRRVCS
ncbi:hypothetical protein FB45DRAFT_915827 [Roridomyces roridus]|uniref:Uncharacterized protein n=1 Tax=Roridomyces roridus TaxID=1738132 RepID=A0AAD7BTP6_9AGAR|nr:hypothetical protein FB45DRAFT_915827 [Roridomyces roridus]